MANYKVNYKNSDKKVYIEADSPRHAYIKFLEQSDIHEKPVIVTFESALGSGAQTQSFSDHLNEFLVSKEIMKVSSYAIESKLDELIGLIRHIRLMFYFFCLVTVVVPYFVAQLNN